MQQGLSACADLWHHWAVAYIHIHGHHICGPIHHKLYFPCRPTTKQLLWLWHKTEVSVKDATPLEHTRVLVKWPSYVDIRASCPLLSGATIITITAPNT